MYLVWIFLNVSLQNSGDVVLDVKLNP